MGLWSAPVAANIMAGMARRVASPVFIGRRAELERVAAGLRAAAGGQPAAFLVGGEAGVGKTRFVEESAAMAREAGFRVLAGSCIELAEGGLPYAPIVEALRPLPAEYSPADLDRLLGAGRAELVRLMPEIGEAHNPHTEGAGAAQGRLFELLVGFLTRLSAERPLLCVVEDLHWADRSTLDLIAFAVRTLRQGAIALLATYRSDELHRRHPLLPVLAELERSGRIERLELGRFGRPELEAQVAGILGGPPELALLDQIWARSGGNAFYAEELLAAGAVRNRLPDTLREVLLARVAALSEPAQELLRVAAAGGARISGPLLAALTGTAEADLLPALREAVGRGLILPAEDGAGGYAFRHALLQETLYADLLPGERTSLHASYARALSEDADPSDPALAAELAYHWSEAHDLPRALEASVAAGRAAERSYAYAEAQAQLERALELWDRVPDAESRSQLDRVGLLERAARAAWGASASSRAIAHVRAAVNLVDADSEPVRAGLLHELLGEYTVAVAESEAGLAECREAVHLVPADPPSAARARVLAQLGRCLWLMGHDHEAAELCDEAIGVAHRVGASDTEAQALITRANCLGFFGEIDRALADCQRAREIALDIGAPELVTRADFNLAVMYGTFARRLDEAAAICLARVEYAARNGLMTAFGGFGVEMLAGVAWAYYMLGRWDEAERALEQARLAGAEAVAHLRPFAYPWMRITLDIGHGRLAEAGRQLEHATRLVERDLVPTDLVPFAQLRAELALWQADPLGARAVVAETLSAIAGMGDIADPDVMGSLYAVGLRAEVDLAAASRARRDTDALATAQTIALDYCARMRALYTETAGDRSSAARPVAAWVAADLALCEAELGRLERRPDPAWPAVAAAWGALGLPYRQAYALYRGAEALLAAGHRIQAGEPLRAAHRIVTALDAGPLRSEVEALARRGRLGLGAPVVGTTDRAPLAPLEPFGLTPREREVLALVAAGRTNRQIGEALFISETTASVHVSHVLGKLGVAGRTEAATLAQRLGLLAE